MPLPQSVWTVLQKFTIPPTVLPSCADTLLSLIGLNLPPPPPTDETVRIFEDYFAFGEHRVFRDGDPNRAPWDFTATPTQPDALHADLATCLVRSAGGTHKNVVYPPESCVPHSCVTLGGFRHDPGKTQPPPLPPPAPVQPPQFLQRLFIADVLWLFFIERSGTFQILGAILDDFATRGSYKIRNDGLAAFVLEIMVREMKMGASTFLRERVTAYRRCLGWTTSAGRELGLSTYVNVDFNERFHRFIRSALYYYSDRRLRETIRGAALGGPASTETLAEITLIVRDLQATFEAFDYGRSHRDTLAGIVWAIATFGVVRVLREDLGITRSDPLQKYMQDAYNLLVAKPANQQTEVNRFHDHLDCAEAGRGILLDLQGLPPNSSTGDVAAWLDFPTGAPPPPPGVRSTEEKIERYRAAYRHLTGTDLGAPAAPDQKPVIEQQV